MLRASTVRLAIAALLIGGSLAAQTEPERLIEAGHWKQARAIVEARIAQAPADPLANYLLSQVRNAFGDHESPLPLAEKAVSLDGRTAKYHRQLAECFGVMAMHANIIQQAILAHRFRTEIDRALALDPRDPDALRDLMEFYILAPGILGGDWRRATETAAHLASIDPVAGLLAQARLAAFRKQTASTEAILRRAAETQPPSYRARVALAEFLLSGTPPRFEGALEPAADALSLDPSRVDAYAILADIHAARPQWTELDAILDASARAVPGDLTPFHRAAMRLLASGRNLAKAEDYLRAYLAQPPEGKAPSASAARAQLALVREAQRRTVAKSERPR